MTINYFKVGGCIRDRILGVRSKDIDYAVEAPSFEAMVEDIEKNRGGRIYIQHPEFLTVRAKVEGEDADFVLCRKDGIYKDGRRPETVEPGTIDDDLARRDFTMNAIAERADGSLYDPHGGQHDIQIGMISCVGKAHERFEEDALRMLRAIRFSVTKGFHISSDIKNCLDDPYFIDKIKNVSKERICDEINKCFAHDALLTLAKMHRYWQVRDVIFSKEKNEHGQSIATRVGIQT
jgi:tRNA nucleotidyltransferase (CCA-adding enzyme)